MKRYTNRIDGHFANILLTILYVSVIMGNLSALQGSGMGVIYYQFALSIFSWCWIGVKYKYKKLYTKFLLFVCIIGIAAVTNMFVVGNYQFKMLIWGIFVYPSIALLLFTIKIKKWYSIGLFAGLAIYVLYGVFTGGLELEEITNNSANYLPYYMMLYAIPYIVYCSCEHKKPNIFVPLACLAVSLLSMSRGGILSTGIFTLGVALLGFRQKGSLGYANKFLIIVVLVVFVQMIRTQDELVIALDKFEEYGMDSRGRTEAWTMYLKSLLNPLNLLLGTPIKSLPYVWNSLGGSLHNSYLTLHARLGILSFFIIYRMIVSVSRMCINYRDYSLAILMFCLLEKAFTDADFPGSIVGGDVYVFLMVFYYIDKKGLFYEKEEFRTGTRIEGSGFIPSAVSSHTGE